MCFTAILPGDKPNMSVVITDAITALPMNQSALLGNEKKEQKIDMTASGFFGQKTEKDWQQQPHQKKRAKNKKKLPVPLMPAVSSNTMNIMRAEHGETALGNHKGVGTGIPSKNIINNAKTILNTLLQKNAILPPQSYTPYLNTLITLAQNQTVLSNDDEIKNILKDSKHAQFASYMLKNIAFTSVMGTENKTPQQQYIEICSLLCQNYPEFTWITEEILTNRRIIVEIISKSYTQVWSKKLNLRERIDKAYPRPVQDKDVKMAVLQSYITVLSMKIDAYRDALENIAADDSIPESAKELEEQCQILYDRYCNAVQEKYANLAQLGYLSLLLNYGNGSNFLDHLSQAQKNYLITISQDSDTYQNMQKVNKKISDIATFSKGLAILSIGVSLLGFLLFLNQHFLRAQ